MVSKINNNNGVIYFRPRICRLCYWSFCAFGSPWCSLRKLRYEGLCSLSEITSSGQLRLATCLHAFSAFVWQSDAALFHRKLTRISLPTEFILLGNPPSQYLCSVGNKEVSKEVFHNRDFYTTVLRKQDYRSFLNCISWNFFITALTTDLNWAGDYLRSSPKSLWLCCFCVLSEPLPVFLLFF